MIYQIPVDERGYLKDQKAKIDLTRTFQVVPTDKSAIKLKRERETLEKQKNLDGSPTVSTSNVQDNVSSPFQSPSSSEETEDEYAYPKVTYKLI